MRKTILLGTITETQYNRSNVEFKVEAGVYATIEITDGRLSITGVIGPKSNGDALGSCGQIDSSFRTPEKRAQIKPAEGYTPELISEFFDIWHRWHLNDMRAGCDHQRTWDTSKQLTTYNFRLTREATKLCDAVKTEAVLAQKCGDTYTPSAKAIFLANLPYSAEYHLAVLPEPLGHYYEPKKPLYAGDSGPVSTSTAGHTPYDRHPYGLLSKPCDVCGYKYGTSWLREELPAEVVSFLERIPANGHQTIPSCWLRG